MQSNTAMIDAPDVARFACVPSDLVEMPNWVLWRMEPHSAGEEPTKIPYMLNGARRAKANGPNTWGGYPAALRAYADDPERWSGIGFEFQPPFVGIDLDDCLDDAGEFLPWAAELLAEVGLSPSMTYAEVSPSGCGVKFYGRCKQVFAGKNIKGFGPDKTGGVEAYTGGRFFAVTARKLPDSPSAVNDCSAAVDALLVRLEQQRKHVAAGGFDPDADLASAPPSASDEPTTTPEPAHDLRPHNIVTGRQAGGAPDNRMERCIAFASKLPPSISGANGHDKFFHCMCEGVKFDLSTAQMWDLARWWNQNKTDEVWSDREIEHKVRQAERVASAERGIRLREDRPGWQPRQHHNGNGNGQHHAPDPAAEEPAAEPEPQPRTSNVRWPAPIALDAPNPPEMPTDILPGWLGEMVLQVSAALETPLELAATFGLGALSIATQGRFCVNPQHGQFEPLCDFYLSALLTGSRKTPAYKMMIGWTFAFQSAKAAEFAPLIRRAEADDDVLRARIKSLLDKAAKADDPTARDQFRNEADALEKTRQPIPVFPRLVGEDLTPEKLATLLKEQNEVFALASDEGGFIDTLCGGRYSKDGMLSLDIPLKAWSASPCSIDRQSGRSTFLREPLLTIVASPQPVVLSALVSNETYRRRGLPARFWLFAPRDPVGERDLVCRPVPQDVVDEYNQRLTELVEMKPAPGDDGGYKARRLSLSAPAWRLWKDFEAEIEPDLKPTGVLGSKLRDWGCKLAGKTARVAGLFHLVEHGPDAVRIDEIGTDAMRRAIDFARHATEHAKIIFDGMDEKGDLAMARKVWRHVQSEDKQKKRKEEHGTARIATAQDCWRPFRNGLQVKDIEPALQRLIAHNYLREQPTADVGRPGRPSRRFEVNPALTVEWME